MHKRFNESRILLILGIILGLMFFSFAVMSIIFSIAYSVYFGLILGIGFIIFAIYLIIYNSFIDETYNIKINALEYRFNLRKKTIYNEKIKSIIITNSYYPGRMYLRIAGGDYSCPRVHKINGKKVRLRSLTVSMYNDDIDVSEIRGDYTNENLKIFQDNYIYDFLLTNYFLDNKDKFTNAKIYITSDAYVRFAFMFGKENAEGMTILK